VILGNLDAAATATAENFNTDDTTMDAEAAFDRFDQLAVWSRGDQRAPHKPLLVRDALGGWCRGVMGLVPLDE
jgi:hypothetical protein